jgi:hypothetical protein
MTVMGMGEASRAFAAVAARVIGRVREMLRVPVPGVAVSGDVGGWGGRTYGASFSTAHDERHLNDG